MSAAGGSPELEDGVSAHAVESAELVAASHRRAATGLCTVRVDDKKLEPSIATRASRAKTLSADWRAKARRAATKNTKNDETIVRIGCLCWMG